ncbi:MAG: hypothetical protein HC913_12730 [Microscillaceae bacterium]|nr:hypothetical protein [Microscillaceae bacterium]
MRIYFISVLSCWLLWSSASLAQNPRQKALNSMAQYLTFNQKMLLALFEECQEYYEEVERQKLKKGAFAPSRFTCPILPDNESEYWYGQSLSLSASLGADGTTLKSQLTALQSLLDEITRLARELETYHQLKDYERDHFEGAAQKLAKFPALMQGYQKAHYDLARQLEQVRFRQLSNTPTYLVFEKAMRDIVWEELEVLRQVRYNLAEGARTQDLKEVLIRQLEATEARIWQMEKLNPANLHYQAQNTVKGFIQMLGEIQETRKYYLNEYFYEDRLSDAKANAVLKALQNMLNGGLIADFNLFVQYCQNSGTGFLSANIPFIPMIWKIDLGQNPAPDYAPRYQAADIPGFVPVSKPEVWNKQAYQAFLKYAEFLNEGIRTYNFFNAHLLSNIAYQDFANQQRFYFNYSKYVIPITQYHYARLYTQFLPPECQASLLAQAQNIMSLWEEMDAYRLELTAQYAQKKYLEDNFARIAQIRDRVQQLSQIMESLTDSFRRDLWAVFESRPLDKPASSWQRSARALHELVLEERKVLLATRDYLQKKNASLPDANAIDALLRKLLTDEYDNMKGIEKLGRYNGLCPYSPYEDIAKEGQRWAEILAKQPREGYEPVLKLYNNTIQEYNRFVSLSPDKCLPEIYQPAAFFFKEPLPASNPRPATRPNPTPPNNTPKGIQVGRDTVIIYRTDTVFVYQTDTVYLDNSMVGEEFYSLEGFAPNNMVLLVDVSGSMNAPSRLPLLKTSLKKLVGIMRPEDE